ncbi:MULTISPECIES: ROK family transcriptional regulator [unclassified Exiguobacterium]|uniref:ROK family transcriptional regulator n=1 Tax=unclassified Exiguobacterium TaxID=2644629 RepID=UPI00103A064B|nr:MULTISPECIES: ROK family transcriptional regulator [unclassified Exiguobacterium]TCI48264.1 ROK family transcriptional regulator [Exiguobacterium sp. SH5S32]TCI55150.1 ROK family transcriptional regulator [Exiguobacterium sp. SH1S4]TCI74944.1 ROK family transcriptional regulator [Exiguobacterium sp. SH1S1]
MGKTTPRNSKWMRTYNRSLILRLIRLHQPVSRVELAKATNLTKPTISNIVNELKEEGLVNERELGVSSGGRRPIMLELAASDRFVIGIDATQRKLHGVVTNIHGELLDEAWHDERFDTNEEFIDAIVTLYIQLAGKTSGDVIGLGVSVHGMVEAGAGMVLFAPRFHLHDIPLKRELEARLKQHVFVENDVRTLALGELYFGEAIGIDEFFYVYAGYGIGGAYVHGGELIDGEHHIAGEIGHMRIMLDGPICSCGNRGCLEAVAGERAILNEARELYDLTLDGMRDAVGTNPDVQKLYERAGEYVGIATLNMIHLLNPSRILLGGPLFNYAPQVVTNIQERVAQTALTMDARQTDIRVVPWNANHGALGAAALITNQLFGEIQ